MTKFVTKEPARLDSGTLIKDLLGLEPSDLVSKETACGGNALQHLGAFMRRVIETSVQVRGLRDLTIYLSPDAEAEANGWRNDKVADLSALLIWGLIQPSRRVKGLPTATLRAAKEGAIDQPVDTEERLRALPISELIAEFDRKIPGEPDTSDWGTAQAFPLALGPVLRSALGLDPATLRFYRTDVEMQASADEHARVGLERFAQDVLAQYKIMQARRTTTVRLMSVDDAQSAAIPDVRAAHIATLLAASLQVESGHDVLFLAPRTRSPEEKAMLRQTAKAVYLDYSDEALQGFELICDGIVHFGHGLERTIAEKLLYEVAEECDPDLQRMPYCVAHSVGLDLLLKAC